jgi:hypothetical protein
MREILLVVAAVWGGSFSIAITWFAIDERKYRRGLASSEQAEASAAEEATTSTRHTQVNSETSPIEGLSPAMA